jgi:hypothetical protein
VSNFVFGKDNPPGTPRQSIAVVRAFQLWSGEGLPSSLADLTSEERVAILSLDPFFFPALGRLIFPGFREENPFPGFREENPARLREERLFVERQRALLPPQSPRYVHVLSRDLGANVFFEQTVESIMMAAEGTTLTKLTRDQVSATEDLPVVTKLAVEAAAYGGGELAKKAADAVIPGSGELVGPVIDKLPALYEDKTDTTVVTTLSRNTLIETANDNAVTQSFHVQDTDRPMAVDMYYDTLFGTFAFFLRE